VGKDNPYVILHYICHKGAFYVRQTDSDILAVSIRGRKERGSGEEGGRGGYRGSGFLKVGLN